MSETTALVAPEQESPVPAIEPDYRAGTAALALMTDDEFETRLAALKAGRDRIRRIHLELMDAGVDFGVIPGTQKATLLQPGAEKLCDFYRLAAEFAPEVSYGDGEERPAITVLVECRLHLGTLDGPVVCTGHGAATSWEVKYRYRRGQRNCPACGCVGTIRAGKQEYGGGWYCNRNAGGCGTSFKAGDERIEGQAVGDVENPDPYDLLNTVVKMAEKRAHVAATRRATATSGLYAEESETRTPAPASRSAGRRGGEKAIGESGKPPLSEAEDVMGRANRAYRALGGDPNDADAYRRDQEVILKKRIPAGFRLTLADWKKLADAWEAQVLDQGAERGAPAVSNGDAAVPAAAPDVPQTAAGWKERAAAAMEGAEGGTFSGTLIDAPPGTPAQIRGA